MRCFTIGYGGRKPADFIALLKANGVRTLVDVRLRPDRSSLGSYARASTPEKGIEKLLADHGIRYVSLIELGNLFMGTEDWPQRYRRLVAAAGDLLIERLRQVEPAFCMMCAERDPAECHREPLSEFLATRGYEVEHIR